MLVILSDIKHQEISPRLNGINVAYLQFQKRLRLPLLALLVTEKTN
jgi:hypothetical protein